MQGEKLAVLSVCWHGTLTSPAQEFENLVLGLQPENWVVRSSTSDSVSFSNFATRISSHACIHI
jgi:hypothetical protein